MNIGHGFTGDIFKYIIHDPHAGRSPDPHRCSRHYRSFSATDSALIHVRCMKAEERKVEKTIACVGGGATFTGSFSPLSRKKSQEQI
jgi:tryptophan synthase beta subunit